MASNAKTQSNQKMYERNLPSHVIQPYLSSIPENIRYQDMNDHLHSLQRREEFFQKSKNIQLYSQETVFNPGDKAPWSGFSSNVDTESILRNQTCAYQKGDVPHYVPSSQSDLYQHSVETTNSLPNTHPLLFRTNHFSPKDVQNNIHVQKTGYKLFMNETRVQMKDLNK
jgi:hypothetical protein